MTPHLSLLLTLVRSIQVRGNCDTLYEELKWLYEILENVTRTEKARGHRLTGRRVRQKFPLIDHFFLYSQHNRIERQ